MCPTSVLNYKNLYMIEDKFKHVRRMFKEVLVSDTTVGVSTHVQLHHGSPCYIDYKSLPSPNNGVFSISSHCIAITRPASRMSDSNFYGPPKCCSKQIFICDQYIPIDYLQLTI